MAKQEPEVRQRTFEIGGLKSMSDEYTGIKTARLDSDSIKLIPRS